VSRAVTVAFGAVFGFAISWGQFTDPDRLREMLLLRDAYLYVMMATAVAVGFAGARLLRRLHARALLTGEPVAWTTSRPERRHVTGAAIFGLGWAITDSCPAPIAGQLAQGVGWSLFTIAGVFLGLAVFFRGQERPIRAVPADATLDNDRYVNPVRS
jgi:uncharacterized membrane protein YedE/YeeE